MPAATATKANPRVIIKRSPIHGRGLFAAQPIAKGELVGRYEGPPAKRDGKYVLWIVDEEGNPERGIKGENEMRFMNHSANPNVEWDEEEVYALRDIAEGEEITIHYGDDWNDL